MGQFHESGHHNSHNYLVNSSKNNDTIEKTKRY